MASVYLQPEYGKMVLEFYEQQMLELRQEERKLNFKRRLYGWLRLGCVVIVALIFSFYYPQWKIVIPSFIAILVVFRLLIYRDVANKETLLHNSHLQKINEAEIGTLKYDSYELFNDGSQHIPHDHYYAGDLDIFGHSSLFRILNRTVSEIGSRQLANWLLSPADKEKILLRQEAAKELSTKPIWLQHLQAYGKEHPVTHSTFDILQNWIQQPPLFKKGYFKIIRWVLPSISVAVTIATIFSWIPMNIFYLTLLGMFIIAFILEKKVNLLHLRLGKVINQLDTLSSSIAIIEKESFKSTLLVKLQADYIKNNQTASTTIAELKKILDSLDLRLNIVLAVPLNLLFLWNLQQCLRLEKWKATNDNSIHYWFNNLGIFEALGSFAVTSFNKPDWAFPTLTEEPFSIHAANLGHPLIPKDKRVTNFINLEQKPKIMLVTGSNMAGKSTYLRSVGVNIVLAMAGAPVCASSFSLPAMQLLSSMRIADNLEESTSTFYAELKKLKTVIDKVNLHENVFILLDEILRGTNTLDRHAGSEALIKQLVKKDAVAIIATHDLALANLQQQYPGSLENFHFDVQVSNEELYFDYKLKPGICTSMNASILMKKIGIELS